MTTLLITRPLPAPVADELRRMFDVTQRDAAAPLTSAEAAEALGAHDAILATVGDAFTADAFAAHPMPRTRLIANFGAGTEHIDLEAAKRRGIMVTNTPGVFTDDTADLTMALIIGVPRRMREGVSLVRSGEWTGWAPSAQLGRKLGGKCLGIVGMGRIGQAVAHRARAFGLDVIYHNRKRLPEAAERMLGAQYVADLDTLVAKADILSLHCPATPETHHLMDARRIAMMPRGASLINTARGELIEQDALIEALESGHLAGAGLDVYPDEPHVDPRLLAHPNVMTLPHIGSATVEGREASGEKIIANIRFWMDGHRPPDQVLIGFS